MRRLPPAVTAVALAALALPAAGWLAAQDTPAPGVLATLKGHDQLVYSVAFSPDGKQVVTGSADNSVRLWDAATGKELRSYAGTNAHTNLVLSVAFAPDGQTVASGGSDNTARLWDVPVATPLRELTLPDAVTAAALTADGKLLAAGDNSGAVRLYGGTPAHKDPLFNLTGHVGAVSAVSFAGNGQLLATAGADGTLRYWDPVKGQAVGVVGAHPGAVTAAAVSPGNNLAFTAGADGTLKFWNLPPQPSKSLPAHAAVITAVSLSPDGNNALTAGADKLVRLAALANGQVVREFTGAAAAVNAASLSPNGATVAAGTADDRLHVWNAADGKALGSPAASLGGVTAVGWNAAGTQVHAAGNDGRLKVFALPLKATVAVAHPEAVRSAVLTADGKRLVTGGADKLVRIWRLEGTPAPERQFAGHTAAVGPVALSPDGGTVASAGEEGLVRLWSVSAGKEAAALGAHAGPAESVAFHPNGSQLLTAGADGAVKVWQLPVTPPKPFAHPDAVTCLAVTPDGNRLVTGGADKQVRVWNLQNGSAERAVPGGTLAVAAVAVSADGATLAVAGADKSVVLYTLADGKEKTKLPALPAAPSPGALAFSPDGKLLAVGLGDNSVRLFDVATAKEVKNVAGHAGPVTALAWSAKGDLLATAGADKTARTWAPDGTARAKFDLAEPAAALAISKDGTRLAVAGKSVAQWTLADGKPLPAFATPADIRGLAYNGDGTRLATAGADGQARLYAADGALLESFPHEGPVAAVAFHADGKRLVTAGADKTARLWTPALLWRATVGGPARQAVWTPNGQTVVAVGDDKSVRLLEAATGKESKVLTGHAGPVRSVSVSADAAKAATGSDDGTAVVWTLADGKAVTTIKAGAPVTRVSLSPDGKRVGVAFTTAGKAVTAVHDAATGDELQTFAEAGGRALAFAADNRTLLALPENDKTVHLLDVAVVSARKAHEGSVTALAVVPGADQPITAGKDKTARRWSPNEAKEVRAFGPLADPATAVAVSRDGAQLALAGGKVVKLYDASSGAEAATLTHPAEVVSVAFSPDRSRILTGATDNLARVWDVKSGVVLQLFSHGGAVRGVAWHPSDANRVVTASADKTAAAHTVTLQRLVALPKPAAGLTVAPNGSHLLVWDETDDVKLVNVGGGNFERTFAGNKGPVKAAAFSKDQQRVAVAGADKQVRIFGANDAREFAGFALPAPAVALQYNPTATAIAAALADGTVGAWNATVQPGQQPPPELGRAVQTFSHPGAAVALFNSDGTGLFTGGSDKAVRQWKLAADTPLKRFDHPNLVDAVAFSPDGKTLLTGCHDGLARTFDIAKGAVLKAVNAHDKPMPAPIYAVAWTPDGKQFATASYDHSVKLWDAAGGTMVREFKGWTEKTFEQGHREGIFSLAFSPDGKYLATASSDRDVKLWDVAQGTVVRTFANPNLKADAPPVVGKPAPPPPSHPSWVYAVRFTPDGKYLVSAGTSPRDRKANPDRNRGYLAVWNPADGKLVSAQEYPLGGLYSLAVASDNERAVLGCGPASRDAGKVDAVVVKLPK